MTNSRIATIQRNCSICMDALRAMHRGRQDEAYGLMRVHPRCRGCTILVGPGHNPEFAITKTCATCAARPVSAPGPGGEGQKPQTLPSGVRK